jgi:hypothetical protein
MVFVKFVIAWKLVHAQHERSSTRSIATLSSRHILLINDFAYFDALATIKRATRIL